MKLGAFIFNASICYMIWGKHFYFFLLFYLKVCQSLTSASYNLIRLKFEFRLKFACHCWKSAHSQEAGCSKEEIIHTVDLIMFWQLYFFLVTAHMTKTWMSRYITAVFPNYFTVSDSWRSPWAPLTISVELVKYKFIFTPNQTDVCDGCYLVDDYYFFLPLTSTLNSAPYSYCLAVQLWCLNNWFVLLWSKL